MDKISDTFKWLWLTSCFGVGNKGLWNYLGKNLDFESKFDMIYDKDKRAKLHLSNKEMHSAASITDKQVNELISYCKNHNIGILCYSDKEYPDRLKNIFNPPAVLFYKGNLDCLYSELILSVVGARTPSEYSKKITTALIRQLSEFELTIVSGFALGIDIEAHLAAIRNGAKTIAVIGCGIEHSYPADNMKYRDEILANGVIISEYYPKTKPASYMFPARNRILSGISAGTIVIEASTKSGSLITANLALSHGHDIFTIPPHNLFDSRYYGNIKLLRDGAIPIYGIQDIIYEYYENYSHKLTQVKNYTKIINIDNTDSIKNNLISNSDNLNPIGIDIDDISVIHEVDLTPLDDVRKNIMNILIKHNAPMLVDEISLLSGISIDELFEILTSLELDEYIESRAGNSFTISNKGTNPTAIT